MITANELRIGNWVDVSHNISTVMSVRLDGIHVMGNAIVNRPDQVDPIPLTAEILLACGFRHQVEDDTSYYIKNGLWFCHTGNDWYLASHVEYKPFQSLHQLQNLYFALTGTELNYSPELLKPTNA